MAGDMDKRLRSVGRCYSRLVRELPEPLKSRSRSLAAVLAPDSRDLVSYYGERQAYPLLRFPLWLEDKYICEGRMPARKGYGVKTAAAALFGYLYIRVQDNVLDEPDQFDSAYLLLANEFVREFFETYHGLFPPGSPFWGYLREFWRATSNNTLWEREACSGRLNRFDPEDLARTGAKLDGAKTSIASVCLLADGESDIPRFCGVMDRINMASQLHNDVVSFVKDLRHSYFTTVIANTLGEGGEGGEPTDLLTRASLRALTGNHLEEWLARAARYNSRALEHVEPGEMPGLEEYVSMKNAHLERLGSELVKLKKEMFSL